MMFAAIAITVPFLVLGADATGLDKGFDVISGWLGKIGQLIISATVVAFFWGLFQFVFNEEKKEEGKSLMMWGIIALFIMLSFWGIIEVMQNSTVGSDGGANVKSQLKDLVPTLE